MATKFNFNLKESKKEDSLLMLLCRWENQQIKVSTKQRVNTSAWKTEKQHCVTSRELFPARVNAQSKRVNKFLEKLSKKISEFYDQYYYTQVSAATAKSHIQRIVDDIVSADDRKNETLKKTPIQFFEEYIENKRIDPHTGRYIGERTKIHQRTVINRLKSFLIDTHLPNEFSTFTSKRFDSQFTEWCYSVKKYKQNTVYATYGVLKPLLNAAKEEGFPIDDNYRHLKANA